MNLRTRLDNLETIYRSATSNHITDAEQSFLAWLSEPSLWTVLSEFAEKLAHRRYRHEGGCAWYANETKRDMIARHRTSAHSLAQGWRQRHPTW